MATLERQYTVPEMCTGCARKKLSRCEVIIEPAYIHEQRGKNCFAKVDAARAQEIEDEIEFNNGKPRKKR